ncbi:hypothetical protein Lal_00047019 [Lupinus albus]|nr:hypothetical protein Lal_00047019 [Lupinus albus]
MESKSEQVNATISINPNTIVAHPSYHCDQEPEPSVVEKKKKTHGSKNIFKVALFMMRGHHRKSKLLHVDDGSRSIWRNVVGSMRPLHLQNNNFPIQIPKSKSNTITTLPYENQNTSDHHSDVDGFDSASDFANSPSPMSSRYASAVGLNEMVQDEENVMVEEDGNGDEMIDAKAEEFIARFYREMKLQSLDITDPHYNEISMRSLGLSC